MALKLTNNAAFQDGLTALQAGRANDAERLFKDVLRAEPRHVGALNLLGVVLTQLGRFAEAEPYLRRAVDVNPNSDATLYNYGLVLKALKRPAEALERFSQALKLNPSIAETWNNRGTVFNDLGRIDEAVGDFDKAVALNPRYAEAFCNNGKALTALGRPQDALAAFAKALALKPDLAEAQAGHAHVFNELRRGGESAGNYGWTSTPNAAEELFKNGLALLAARRPEDAIASLDRAIGLKPDFTQAHLLRAKLLTDLGCHDDALAGVDKLIAITPGLAEAWLGRSNILFELRRHDEAFAACERALALKPDLAEAWLGRGNVLNALKRYDEALADYDKALALNPDLVGAWHGRGNVFNGQKRHDEALAAYDKALALVPEMAEAWLGRGNVLDELNRYDEAFAAFDRALALIPDLAEAWLGRGNMFVKLKQYDDAFAAYDRALALQGDLAEAWLGRGNVFVEVKQYENAFTAYDRALALDPDIDYAAGFRLYAKLQTCDWTNWTAEVEQLLSAARAGQSSISPFALLGLPSTAADQLQSATRYMQDRPAFPPVWRGEVYSHDRIRIAYLSADLREHPVAQLMAGLFEHHDRSRFEVTALSLSAEEDSDIGRRLKASFEHFIDVHTDSNQAIAELIRKLEIDIVVDLNGFTQNGRPDILMRRPAPVQVNYLGYAATMGPGHYDYIIADATVIPKGQFEFFEENVVWLPDSFMANDAKRPIAEHTPTRRDLNLPEEAFVFCCFNQSHKIDPTIFDVWMRLLRQVDGSVLWLREKDPAAMRNLRGEAARRGVAPERLIFAPRTPHVADHLARHRQADLFLDTLHYNAHATASDALWAGLPVVTCLGTTFAGRVGASLLQAVGLPDLITSSLPDYEVLALRLARDPSLLTAIKARLAENRGSRPLFDTERFARAIEAAYATMWQAYQERRAPSSFAVS